MLTLLLGNVGISNWLGILVAAIVGIIIGAIWYSPVLFGGHWARLNKISQKDMQKMMKSAGPSYLLMFAAMIIMAIVLELLIGLLNVSTLSYAAALGLLIWIGFIATTNFSMAIFQKKSAKLYIIENLHVLIELMVMAMVLVLI